MSKTIDQKVVEMRFDNKNFESGVQSTMSMLDRLKQSLSFKDASKGFENLSSSARNVDMNTLGNGVESVRAKFSALEVVGVTALANLTNSATNAAKNIVKQFTIEPITTGFNEYELKMNSVQTIMASTGESLETVNGYLEELNKYSDQTIYSFSDMTQNIGKFTNAGVKLDDAVLAIKGISNEAAVSGANANEASRAMYNFAQALSAGYVKLIDWKSIENANMATVEFKNELLKTAEAMGTVTKVGDKYVTTTTDANGKVSDLFNATSNFNEALNNQWMTSEVLVETLKRYADETTDIGKKAYASAQDVKTFSMMMDTLKEAAQSGWAQTWELVVGDFEESKKLWTELSETFGDMIAKSAESRNSFITNVLDSKWTSFTKKVENAGIKMDDFKKVLIKTGNEHGIQIDKMIEKEGSLEAVISKGLISKEIIIDALKKFADTSSKASKSTEDMTGKLKRFQKVVDQVWNGDFKNGKERIEALEKAGYKYAEVQALVNKTVDGHKLTLEDLSDTQLKNIGYTDDQIKKIRELAEEAEKSGTPLNELISSMDKPSGRELLIDSVRNALEGLKQVLGAIREAWSETFSHIDSAGAIYNLIDGIHTLSEKLVMNENAVENLKTTLKGLFALIDIIRAVIGGWLSVGLKLLGALLGNVELDILDVTAAVANVIVKFHDWLFENNIIIKSLEKLGNMLRSAAAKLKELYKEFMALPIVQECIEKLKDSLSEFKEVGSNITEGLKNGLKDGIASIPGMLAELGRKILEAIKNVLGIHSPSKEMEIVGENIVDGLFNGVKSKIDGFLEFIRGIGSKILEVFNGINWKTVFAGGISIAMISTAKKLSNTLENLTAPLSGFGSMMGGVGEVLSKSAKGIEKILKNTAKVVKGFSKILKSFAFSIKAKAIRDIAISLAILVGSIVLLTLIDTNKLWESIKIIGSLAGILAGLVIVVEGLSILSGKLGSGIIDFGKLSLILIGVSASLLILAGVIKIIGSMDPEKAIQGFKGLFVMIGSLALFLTAYGTMVKGKAAKNIDELGKMLFKLSIALLLISAVVKILGNLSQTEIVQGGIAILGFVGIVALLTLITKLAGKKVDKLGDYLLKISASMLIMAAVIKIVGGMSKDDLIRGGVVLIGFVGIIALLTLIGRLAGKNAPKIGTSLMSMAASMFIMAFVVKILSNMKEEDIDKGIKAIWKFVGVIAVLTLIAKLAGDSAPKIALTILAMSFAIGVLAAVSILLSLIDVKGLAKGIIAVGFLSLFMTAMIWATRKANDCKGNLIVMTVAIGIMTAAIAALSMIDPSKLFGATAALSIVTGMFALLIAMTRFADGSIGVLITMTLAVGMIAGLLYLLSGLPTESTLAASIALSLVLLSMAAAIGVLNLMGTPSLTAIGVLVVMGLVVAELAVILHLLSGINTEGMLTAVASIVILLGSMLIVLGLINLMGPSSLTGIGALALMGLVVAELALILGVMAALDITPSIETAAALSILLLSMSAVCLILSAVGATGPAAFIGIGALATLIAGIGTLIVGIGALVDHFPRLEEFLNKGIPILEKIGYGLGSFFGNIIGGFLEGITSGLPKLASDLSLFMVGLTPFIMGAKTIDESVVNGVVSIAEMIAILTAVDLLNGLTSWITGGSSLTDFAMQLVPFGTAMKDFSNEVSGIDESAVTAAANAGKAMAEMAKALPKEGGLVSLFSGKNDMTVFATKMVPFGKAMKEFSNEVYGIDAKSIKNAANAGKALAEMANDIPKEGGLVSKITGENDLASFAKKLIPFGKSMSTFSMVSMTILPEAVNNGVEAGKAVGKMAEAMPKEGGLISKITGENDIASFAKKLIPFGTSMVSFSAIAIMINIKAVEKGVEAGKALAGMAETVPKLGGIFKKDDLTKFAEKIVPFGNSMKNFSDNVSGIDGKSLKASLSSFKEIVSLGNSVEGKDYSGLGSLGENLGKIGTESVNKFINAFTSASGKADNAGKTLVTNLENGIRIGVMSVGSIVNAILQRAFSIFATHSPKFQIAGRNFMLQMVSGIKTGSTNVSSACTSTLSTAISSIEDYWSDFYDAGSFLVQGFADGISSNTFMAEAEAVAMAEAAIEAAKEALGEQSPSKVFYKIGDYAGIGFVNAFKDNVEDSYSAGSSIAKSATDGLSDALSRVNDSITFSESYTPTIKPVVDMSSVKASKLKLNADIGMSMNRPIESLSQIVTRSQYEIDRSNQEVVSAIKGLREDINAIYDGEDQEIGLYIDGKKLASSIAKPMNRQLNILSKRGSY